LATRLGIDPAQISVKATSPEGVGALGRGEAIAASAVALLERDS
ncbi:MAG: 2-C-methyl-D-erythritol 2,4-cyclodiphosphate synthase, partial [Candidatus Dormiibacterota bacterium]